LINGREAQVEIQCHTQNRTWNTHQTFNCIPVDEEESGSGETEIHESIVALEELTSIETTTIKSSLPHPSLEIDCNNYYNWSTIALDDYTRTLAKIMDLKWMRTCHCNKTEVNLFLIQLILILIFT